MHGITLVYIYMAGGGVDSPGIIWRKGVGRKGFEEGENNGKDGGRRERKGGAEKERKGGEEKGRD